MTRMTHHIREKLLKDLIERRFKDQAQELMKRRAAFATPYLSEGERRAILPAIPRNQINNILGLPPSEKEIVE